jgi:hypothetical protein
MENDFSRLTKFLESEFKLVHGDKDKQKLFQDKHNMAINAIESCIYNAKSNLEIIKKINKKPLVKPQLLENKNINQLKPLYHKQQTDDYISENQLFGIRYVQVVLQIPNKWLNNYKIQKIIQPNVGIGKALYQIDLLSIPKDDFVVLSNEHMIINIYILEKYKKKIKILFKYNKNKNNEMVSGYVIQRQLL